MRYRVYRREHYSGSYVDSTLSVTVATRLAVNYETRGLFNSRIHSRNTGDYLIVRVDG